MKQNLVKVDWNVAKEKMAALREQAVTKVADRASTTKSYLSEKFAGTKSATMNRIADRGINLTRKQLNALEQFKKRVGQ